MLKLKNCVPSSLLVYVDEAAGSDETGDGSKAKPFLTPLGALLGKGQEFSLFIKKSGEEPAKDADSDGYAPISTSASKKAKKGYEVAMKKKQKQSEQASKPQEEDVKDEQRLEDSKKIILEEPTGTYKKVSRRIAVLSIDYN